MDIPLRIIVTSEDNIQTWSVPSLGISLDACPGQISTVDITIDPVSQGIHYGRSSEICDKGPSHRLFLLRILTPNLFYFYLPQQTIIEDIKDSGDDAGNSGLGGFLNFFKNIWQSSVSLLGHFFDKDRISKF